MVSLSALAVGCGAAALVWVALSLLTVLGRARYDRRRGSTRLRPTARLKRELRRAQGHHGELGKWRRVTALHAVARSGSPEARPVLEAALRDADVDVVGAAVRALGEAGAKQDWAVAALVEALEQDRAPRSRIAAQLERLAPRPGKHLPQLLDHPDPGVRFWGVTLLAHYGGVAAPQIRRRTRDQDPNVRAAAAETLAAIGDRTAVSAVVHLLEDPEWFVRVHACRAAAHLGGLKVAPSLVPLLADERWWVRVAAKDGLRMLGPDTLRFLAPELDSSDRFARNGAAEVLQDLGIVDRLLQEAPDSDLLERIFLAGGDGLRAAASRRVAAHTPALPERLKVA